MKFFFLLLALTLLPGCGEDFWNPCSAGDMRCDGSVAQMCNEHESWEDYQNCGSIGETCYTSASHCGGYVDIACCD